MIPGKLVIEEEKTIKRIHLGREIIRLFPRELPGPVNSTVMSMNQWTMFENFKLRSGSEVINFFFEIFFGKFFFETCKKFNILDSKDGRSCVRSYNAVATALVEYETMYHQVWVTAASKAKKG